MGITIQSIIEKAPDKVKAMVLHGENKIVAHVNGNVDEVRELIGSEIIVEMDYARIVSWTLIKDFDDNQSGIFDVQNNYSLSTVRGRIHNSVEIAPRQAIIDLYLLNHADFLSVDSKELEDLIPEIGIGMELIVEGLCFYPTKT